jgi:hypothetical protein
MISPTACGVCQVHHVHQNTIIQKPFSEVVNAPKKHQVHDIHHFSIIPKYQYLKKCLENGVYDVLRYTKYMIITFSVKYPTRARRKVYGKTPYGVFGVLIRARSPQNAEASQIIKGNGVPDFFTAAGVV